MKKAKVDWITKLPEMEKWRNEFGQPFGFSINETAKYFGVNPQGYYRALDRLRKRKKLRTYDLNSN